MIDDMKLLIGATSRQAVRVADGLTACLLIAWARQAAFRRVGVWTRSIQAKKLNFEEASTATAQSIAIHNRRSVEKA